MCLYICRHFAAALVMTLGMIMGLIYLVDVIELLRRSSSSESAGFATVLLMAAYKLPQMIQTVMPFAVMIAGMICFIGMTRSRELVVMRAAGVSVWQILAPVVGLALFVGVFNVTTLNPFSAFLYQRYEQLVDIALLQRGDDAPLQIGAAGLWLREDTETGQTVLHAEAVRQEGFSLKLREVSIFILDKNGRFQFRIEAPLGTLQDKEIRLEDVRIFEAEKSTQHHEQYLFSTTLTIAKIQDNFASSETVSFWELPKFIAFFESAGFSANRQKLYFQSLLSQPLLLAAMVLIAAVFTLRPNMRAGGLFMRIVAGIAAGFFFYFFSQIIYALGLSTVLPAALAAWSPALIAGLVGMTALFHLEDG